MVTVRSPTKKNDILNFIFSRWVRDGSELAQNGLDLINEDRDRLAGIVMDVIELLVKGEASSAAVLFVFSCERFPSGSTGVEFNDDGLVDGFNKKIKE
jgi:hypothetical protein